MRPIQSRKMLMLSKNETLHFFENLFKKLDTNGDGKISHDELQNVWENLFTKSKARLKHNESSHMPETPMAIGGVVMRSL